MDGPWQIGHKTAEEYARLAPRRRRRCAGRPVDRAGRVRQLEPDEMPTFGSWEATVLGETYDAVDYVSLHGYYEQHGDDRDSFLASATDMDRFIDAVVATCDHVRAVGRHKKRINLSFDEWNVWYQSRFPARTNLDWARRRG
jgi:alpha-N-arabinofuranosidase